MPRTALRHSGFRLGKKSVAVQRMISQTLMMEVADGMLCRAADFAGRLMGSHHPALYTVGGFRWDAARLGRSSARSTGPMQYNLSQAPEPMQLSDNQYHRLSDYLW